MDLSNDKIKDEIRKFINVKQAIAPLMCRIYLHKHGIIKHKELDWKTFSILHDQVDEEFKNTLSPDDYEYYTKIREFEV